MDNDDKFVGHVLSRREAIQKASFAGIAALIGGSSVAKQPQDGSATGVDIKRNFLVATPELTEGPFFEDENLNRYDLTSGTNRPSVVNGLPLILKLRTWELSGTNGMPLKGVKVDIWHTCANGVYSDEPNGGNGENTVGQTWLRGYQVTDKTG